MRSEKVDVRALLNGVPGDANYTNPAQRMEERERVLAYWPDDLIVPVRDGFLEPPPWRLYLDPTAWHDVPTALVHNFVRFWLTERRRWPALDSLRRHFGRVSNHRGPSEVPEQEALL